MNMSGEQKIALPRQRVWQALNDPAILRASIPGCQSLDKDGDDRFTAIVEVKMGPIGARFKGAVTLGDLDPPNGYTLGLQGNGGIAGSVKGNAKLRLSDDAGGTLVAFDVEAQVGGRMAQLGGPIIDATAKQLADKFFSRFAEIVGGGGVPAANPAAPSTEPPHAAVGSPTRADAAQAPGGLPMAWILATVVAALVGFLIGRGQGSAGSDWSGIAIGLLLIVVAGAAFEYGRRAAAPVVVFDQALLRRLLEAEKQ